MYKAGFIGCGSMGGALVTLAAKSVGGENILTADSDGGKLQRLYKACGAFPGNVQEVARNSRFVFLGVKPQSVPVVAEEIRDTLAKRDGERYTVVTMAAGVPAETVSEQLGGAPVIRIMPSMPVEIGEGIILYCTGKNVTDADEAEFTALLNGAGKLVKIDEDRIDIAGSITACGPAFTSLFLEAMIAGGVRCGLLREEAELFALQTVIGSAKLIQAKGIEPAVLCAAVCSPGGSTIEGVAVLEERAMRSAVMEAVGASNRRSIELGKEE